MTQPLRIALISEHASPLACVGGIDAGGQNIYVDHVARTLAARGHQVDVLTRRDDPALPWVVNLCSGVRVIHIPAGPPCFLRKEELLDFMGEFTYASEWLVRTAVSYDLVHANFFMSGLVAQHLKRTLGLPFVMSFHALGLVRREHQKEADAFPDERIAIERSLVHDADAVVAECPQDRTDLIRLYGAEEAQLAMVPCGFDRMEFSPMRRELARARLGLAADEFVVLQLGRLVPRKGIDNVIRSIAHTRALLPARTRLRLVVVGGNSPLPDATLTPEIARLRQVAHEAGVSELVTFTGHRQRAELRHVLRRCRCLRHHAVVRAVRHHAAGGDGLRHPGDRQPRRRPAVLGGRGRDRLPGAAARSAGAGGAHCAAACRPRAGRAHGAGRHAPRARALHLGSRGGRAARGLSIGAAGTAGRGAAASPPCPHDRPARGCACVEKRVMSAARPPWTRRGHFVALGARTAVRSTEVPR